MIVGQTMVKLAVCFILCALILVAFPPTVSSTRIMSTAFTETAHEEEPHYHARSLLDEHEDEDEDEDGEDGDDADEDEDEDDEDEVGEDEDEEDEDADVIDVEEAVEDVDEAVVEANDTNQESDFAEEMGMVMENGIVCPIDLTDDAAKTADNVLMSEYLGTLVAPCTANETTATDKDLTTAFCKTCVRPLQTFLAREFHLADLLRSEEETWDSGNTAIHEQCAADACEFLEAKGMPYDDNFHAAVLECANFAEDPACEFTATELLDMPAIKGAVEKCQEHASTITTKPEAMGSVDSNETATGGSDKHPFCNDCYWPFFQAIVKTTISNEFMCKIKGEDMTPLEMERQVIEDPHMFACLLNVEGKLREQGMQTASIGYTEMEEVCFDDLNHPMPGSETPILMEWLKAEDMVEKLESLSCTDE